LQLGPVEISPEARQALLSYSWPGNIRELENVIHYALIVSRNGIVRSRDLRLHGRVPVANGGQGGQQAGAESDDTLLSEALQALFDATHPKLHAHVEEVLIRQAYEHCGGNQVRTARLLGISRNVLRAQLKRFGLLASSGYGGTTGNSQTFPATKAVRVFDEEGEDMTDMAMD
jgi:sigma-54-specific transcriptional regulator